RPILSRPIPHYQQFWRWCKRNPWLATANITAATLTTALAIVSTVAAFVYRDRNRQVIEASSRIETAERETRKQLFKALSERARAGRFSQRVGQRIDSLAALAEAAKIGRQLKLPGDRLDRLRDDAIACMALPDMKPDGEPIRIPEETVIFAFDDGMS